METNRDQPLETIWKRRMKEMIGAEVTDAEWSEEFDSQDDFT